jgi:hypothetical protein
MQNMKRPAADTAKKTNISSLETLKSFMPMIIKDNRIFQGTIISTETGIIPFFI